MKERKKGTAANEDRVNKGVSSDSTMEETACAADDDEGSRRSEGKATLETVYETPYTKLARRRPLPIAKGRAGLLTVNKPSDTVPTNLRTGAALQIHMVARNKRPVVGVEG